MKLRKAVFVLVACVFFTASPSFAQQARWHVDSEHSTARLVLSSSQKPSAQVNVGVARVSGIVIGEPDMSGTSAFDFTIYPAETPDPRSEYRATDSESPSNARDAVIKFKSHSVKDDGKELRVLGDLTAIYTERLATYDPTEAYSGPVYGPPIVHSKTREVTLEFGEVHQVALQTGGTSPSEWRVSGAFKSSTFPELLRAVETTNWPVLVEDEHCEMPATIGEDYSGPKCTGKTIDVRPRTDIHCQMPLTLGEDFSGEVCTGTPLLTYPTDTDDVRLADDSARTSRQLAANEVIIDLDLRLPRSNLGEATRSFKEKQ